jgi:ADP-heptose:LPS heptosyltransferase
LGQSTRAQHFSEKLIPWLEQLGVDTTDRHYWVPRSTEAAQRVKQWWPTNGEVIGLCPYGASRKRHMSDEQIDLVIEWVLTQPSFRVLIIARAEQTERLKQRLLSSAQADRIVFSQTNDLFELFELVAHCSFVVSVDTAVAHIATGLNKPLLALYGDQNTETENFVTWHPNSKSAIALMNQFDGAWAEEQGGEVVHALQTLLSSTEPHS